MNSIGHQYVVNDDNDLRVGLRKFYSQITQDNQEDKFIQIKLCEDKWLSANGLNMLLIFIEAILYNNNSFKIYIEIFSSDTIKKIINNQWDINKEKKYLANITQKIIFFESIDLLPLLRRNNVIIQPGLAVFEKMREMLHAFKKDNFFEYSSRILALSPLINNEEEQHALTARMMTLANILHKHLNKRIEMKTIFDTSNQIMYELVKNIYQHAFIDMEDPESFKGFACAQINKFPLIIDNDVVDANFELIRSTLEQIRPKCKNKRWRFLCITINDYGVGLHNRVSEDLKNKYKNGAQIGKYTIGEELYKCHENLIKIALTTEYSSKSNVYTYDDQWHTKFGNIKLESRGFGLIYCMSFIAKTCGRMQIRSGNVMLNIFTKATTPHQQEVWSNNLVEITEKLKKSFDDYFVAVPQRINYKESIFPGTQITIEIPVEDYVG